MSRSIVLMTRDATSIIEREYFFCENDYTGMANLQINTSC